MLRQRVFTGIIGFIIVLALIIQGGVFLAGFILVLALFGLLEYAQIGEKISGASNSYLLRTGGILIVSGTYLGTIMAEKNWLGEFLFIIFLLSLIYGIYCGTENFLKRVSIHIFGLIYIPFALSHAILLREGIGEFPFEPVYLIWVPLIVTWVTDISAYFIGNAWGKHKLAPLISPKKSVEGAIGGVFFGVLAAIFLALIWDWPLGIFVSLGVILSITGQLGDLAASCLKRDAGIKDSGNILPGHGGIIDRIDSLIFNLPLAYYFLLLFT